MKIVIGTKGLHLTQQDPFPSETNCKCGGMARIAFVAEEDEEINESISRLHKNEGKGGYWPHDLIAVAVYFCPECFKAVTLWNQA
jgi:hypothetical protein